MQLPLHDYGACPLAFPNCKTDDFPYANLDIKINKISLSDL